MAERWGWHSQRARQGTLLVPWSPPAWHTKTGNTVFLDEVTQTNTVSVCLEVTDVVEMLKHSLQTGVQGWAQPLFTTLWFTAQPLRLASKLHTIITWGAAFSRGFYSKIQQRNKWMNKQQLSWRKQLRTTCSCPGCPAWFGSDSTET